MAEKKGRPFRDSVLWWTGIIGAFIAVLAALPPVPWRYATANASLGMRFSADRRYSLFSATNHFSQAVSYFKYRTETCNKMREFATMNPLTAIAAIASTELGSGGSAAGCASWQVCVEHTSARCSGYGQMAAVGMAAFFAIILGAVCALASVVLMGQEAAAGKKKKKQDEAKNRTMFASMLSFSLVALGTLSFNMAFVGAITNFKQTGFFPWPDPHAGTYLATLSGVILFVHAWCGVTRAHDLWALMKGPKEEEDVQPQTEYLAQGYGGPFGAAPALGDPYNAYGGNGSR